VRQAAADGEGPREFPDRDDDWFIPKYGPMPATPQRRGCGTADEVSVVVLVAETMTGSCGFRSPLTISVKLSSSRTTVTVLTTRTACLDAADSNWTIDTAPLGGTDHCLWRIQIPSHPGEATGMTAGKNSPS